ncbi:MAG: glutathione S-transferase family protein [Yoonia sp.]|nr:glutathione S-transferase family protein [Yoonia sp.]
MTTPLTLYYAPDNASLCVRLALLALEVPFETRLVDRNTNAQNGPVYMALNPNGLIPTLITPDGPIYETGAVLLWLADKKAGHVFPAADASGRTAGLAWLFWLSNTLHPALRMTFYPSKYIEAGSIPQLLTATRTNLLAQFTQLESRAEWLDDPHVGILHCYLAPMLRWAALYGADQSWFDLHKFPRLLAFAKRFEVTHVATQARLAEGLGDTAFSAPSPPCPPEGSAT